MLKNGMMVLICDSYHCSALILDSEYNFGLGVSFHQLAIEGGTGRVRYGLLLAGVCMSDRTRLIQTVVAGWKTHHTMSQRLISVHSGGEVSLSLELGFHGLNPHFGIARVLIEKTGVVVAVPITEVEQGLTQCCGLLAMFNVWKFALRDASTEID